MVYDPLTRYSIADFRKLSLNELWILFEEAKKVSLEVRGFKTIRKIMKDKANMRLLLNGFDSTYNEEYE